jgi:N6-adenosine-specific RNA methylase IME4
MSLAKRASLKERLDRIDREIVSEGKDKVVALWLLEKHAMWRKGREVLKSFPELAGKPQRGGRGLVAVSFKSVALEVGRPDVTISRWVKLVLAHPEEKAFLAWAREQTPIVLAKWEGHLLSSPKVNGVATPLPPEGKFSVILADPPWRYDFSPTDSRQIENQYPTMDVADICKLGENMPFAEDAALFLWATAPKLREALQVIDAWGFKYVTHAIWDKEVIGMGYWFRGQHEPLLVATRGAFPPPPESARVSSIIRSRRAAHSEKPEAVYELIEAAYVDLSDKQRLEVFARECREGWTPWGNEVQRAA